MSTLKLLFVCSMNRWRSPTAEKIFANYSGVQTRSAGTRRSARKTIDVQDLRWADIVFVMEDQHRHRLYAAFPGEMRFKDTVVLDIPDEYKYMAPELIEELTACVEPIILERLP